MIELYCEWRTGCSEVRAAYEWFCDAPAPDRAAAFAAYAAALDREQSVCESYAAQVRLIESLCADASRRVRSRKDHRSDSVR
jgi:hypothetical protein